MIEKLREFLEQFEIKCLSYELEIALDEDEGIYEQFEEARDSIANFVKSAIEENNIAIDGDAILEHIDSEFPWKCDKQAYTDELEAVQFIAEDIIREMHL